MKKLVYLLPVIFFACQPKQDSVAVNANLNRIAVDYVRLGLVIGQYDTDFVDAYYGPDSLKPTTTRYAVFPKDSLLASAAKLSTALENILREPQDDTLAARARWMLSQLTAFGRRIKIFSGEPASFDTEAKELFGITAPDYPESWYKKQLARLEEILPGKGTVAEKFQALANRFIIPKNKIDTVFKTAIAECRKRTAAHYTLPSGENFKLEYVTNKSWSGYNWYKGNYQSLIQINTDIDIFIDRAIDVGSHESYPGHHVYNMLLEKNLYKNKGWVEISLYPLFSPQSFIAEGSANYGIELVFPGDEKVKFTKEILLPLAGLDTTGIDLYFKALGLKGRLNYARNEVGRGIINKTMKEEEALRWLMEYGLNNRETALKSIHFINGYRSYVINYNYGKDLVRRYIQLEEGSENEWQRFARLLSSPVIPAELSLTVSPIFD